MSKVKKVIVGLLVTALAAGSAAGGLNYIKRNNQTEVLVTSVGNIASDYYSPDTTLDANITTSLTQNISVDDDTIIEEIFVQDGQSVKTGDKLVTFDVTLVEMELNIAKLTLQKQQQDLNTAKNRLARLQSGGAVSEEDIYDTGTADNLSSYDSGDDMASAAGTGTGNYLAAAIHPFLLAAFTDAVGAAADVVQDPDAAVTGEGAVNDSTDLSGEGDISGGTGEIPGDNYQDPSAGEFSSGENTSGNTSADGGDFSSGVENENPVTPEPTPTPALGEDVEFVDQVVDPGDPNITDGNELFYQKLDGEAEPYEGSGTEDDPYVFLVSSAKGWIIANGEFFNKMAGYSADGTQILHEGGYWYLLEFHQNDTIADYQNRTTSCTGYYLVDGSLLNGPASPVAEVEFTLADALQYEEEYPDDDYTDDYVGGGGSTGSGLSRAEAIKVQKNRIASLELDIQESELEISRLEKKAARKEVTSKLDGMVAYVGDTSGSSDGEYFMSIKSEDGFYVVGTVGELLLEQVKEGTILECTNYSAEDSYSSYFEAEVVEVSEYPVSSGDMYYYGEGNPNVSSYMFKAVIPDKEVKVTDGDWISVMLAEEVDTSGIVLSKAFVRTENGVSYVYKDDNGVLKRQVVTVGGNVEGGYSVLVKGGLSREDLIAFPYGDDVQEGVKTKEGTLDEMYGY